MILTSSNNQYFVEFPLIFKSQILIVSSLSNSSTNSVSSMFHDSQSRPNWFWIQSNPMIAILHLHHCKLLPVQPQYDVCNMLIVWFKETNQLIFHKKLIVVMGLNK